MEKYCEECLKEIIDDSETVFVMSSKIDLSGYGLRPFVHIHPECYEKIKMKEENTTLNVEIKNVTKAQAIAIEQMFKVWQSFGNIGTSRWVNFFVDGDGNFHPKISIDGKPVEEQTSYFKETIVEYINSRRRHYGGSASPVYSYNIDFDDVAWQLRENNKCALCDDKGTFMNGDFHDPCPVCSKKYK